MIVKLENVEKQIKGNTILTDVSYEFESGKVYGIFGRNGSGKTMLMRCILGLIHTDSGRVLIDHAEIGKDIDFPQSVGAMIENPGFFPHASGFENLLLLSQIKQLINENEIKAAIRRVGLNAEDRRTVSKYSLGMKQRLAIAQAIMEKPDLLILDEPTNALDEEGVNIFRDIIKQEVERGALVIISSHNHEDIEILSDVRIKMEMGRIASIEER